MFRSAVLVAVRDSMPFYDVSVLEAPIFVGLRNVVLPAVAVVLRVEDEVERLVVRKVDYGTKKKWEN